MDQHLPGSARGEENRRNFCVLNLSPKIQCAKRVSKCPDNCRPLFTECISSHSVFVPPPATMIQEGVGELYTCAMTFSAPTDHAGSMQAMSQVAFVLYCCLTPALVFILGTSNLSQGSLFGAHALPGAVSLPLLLLGPTAAEAMHMTS